MPCAKSERQPGPNNMHQRRTRPKFPKRVHPSHADLPYVPPERDNNTSRYWHFGWPASDATVDALLRRYVPALFTEPRGVLSKYARFLQLLESVSGCPFDTVRFVLVEPDATASWQSPLAEKGERGVSFYMIVSDRNKDYFVKRPTKEQVQRLTRLFGCEPRWMMDARTKKEWKDYGHRD
ncbi:hypothetical protein GGF50DRAFT_53272 [Schizophyllum commune]